MTFKILGGQFKGRTLQSPIGTKTRPTLGILRQALFNICQQEIAGAHFLDLFAGSGAMGLEALSWGAAQAVFVEQDPSAVRCIQANIKQLGLASQTDILAVDVFSALKRLAKQHRSFNIVYIDPPYSLMPSIGVRLLAELEQGPFLSPHSFLFLEESSEGEELSYQSKLLTRTSSRRFGIARLHQFEAT